MEKIKRKDLPKASDYEVDIPGALGIGIVRLVKAKLFAADRDGFLKHPPSPAAAQAPRP